jgi:hypothetical protein
MKEKSMTKNHGGGIIGGTIIEKRSLRRNHWKENPREEIIEERGIWEASGTPGGHGAPGGSKSQKSMPLSSKMQTLHLFLISRNVFEGQITK